MKKNFIHYIFVFLILISIQGIFSQDLILKVISKNKLETSIINKIDFKKQHKDSASVFLEIEKISDYLKNYGYFSVRNDSVKKKEKIYVAFFSLNKKVNKAIITLNSEYFIFLKNFKKEKNSFTIPIKKLSSTLLELTKTLENEGKSFSKVQLKKISIKNTTLYAQLDVYQSKKRFINRVHVKGYDAFPKSFLKNYFKLNKKSFFTKEKLKTLSKETKNLKFVDEAKPPEVLFTKDSTKLYLYLKKVKNNSFDGILNIGTKENGNLLINGYLDLKLNNILNTGETFNLFWNRINEERQEFKVNSVIPYIFNSKISADFSFSIYKQDSTFLNTNFNSKIYYNINNKVSIALTYRNENSDKLDENLLNNVDFFKGSFFGFEFKYVVPNNDFFRNNKFLALIKPSFGKRKTDFSNTNQFHIKTLVSYLFSINN